MSQDWLLGSADELAARVHDGAKIAVPHDDTGVAMEVSRALIRRGAKDLHVVCVARPHCPTRWRWRPSAARSRDGSARPIRAS